MIDDLLHRLGEHFDAVQVFVSRQLPDRQTESFSRGVGNWNARWGQVERWVEDIRHCDAEEARIRTRKENDD